MTESLSAVIFGPAGAGKSWVGSTAPGIRCVVECEGGSRFTPVPRVKWDPLTEPLPENLDPNTSVLVSVIDWHAAEALHRYLLTQRHPFKSIIIDTVTELQARLM